MRWARFLVVARLLGAAISGPGAAAAQAPQCSKAYFEAVVDDGELCGHLPPFQGKLRQLKAKRGWSDDQLKRPSLVRDDKIAGFDQRSEEFLLRIAAANPARRPRQTALLAELRAVMQSLVETQKAKWAYMFEKIEAELRR